MFTSIFTTGKDAILAQFIKPKIEPYLSPYTGKIEGISLDSSSRTVGMDLRFER